MLMGTVTKPEWGRACAQHSVRGGSLSSAGETGAVPGWLALGAGAERGLWDPFPSFTGALSSGCTKFRVVVQSRPGRGLWWLLVVVGCLVLGGGVFQSISVPRLPAGRVQVRMDDAQEVNPEKAAGARAGASSEPVGTSQDSQPAQETAVQPVRAAGSDPGSDGAEPSAPGAGG